MENTVEKYREQYRGRKAALFLTGKTLSKVKDIDPEWVTFGVNTSIFADNLPNLDFLLIQDAGSPRNPFSYESKPEAYRDYKPNVEKFYGSFSPLLSELHARDNAMLVRTVTGPVVDMLCEGSPIRAEINPQPFSDREPFATSGSVCFTAIQILALMGFEEINLFGADLLGGRFGDPANLEPDTKFISSGLMGYWKEAKSWLESKDIKVISHNPVALKDLFEEAPTEKKKRLHILVPPYGKTRRDDGYQLCAFIQNAMDFMDMMGEDFDVIHYGHPDSVIPKTATHVDVLTREEWADTYEDQVDQPFFKTDVNLPAHKQYHKVATEEINKRLTGQDFIFPMWGSGNKATAEKFLDREKEGIWVIEASVGYNKTISKHVAFSSRALEDYCCAKANVDPSFFSRVIPYFFNPDLFKYSEKKDPTMFTFVGRVIRRKGIEMVRVLAEHNPEFTFNIIGPGDIRSAINNGARIPSNVNVYGLLSAEQRNDIVSRSAALLAPTRYTEPFGRVVVEALLLGTPVIASDHGAFPEILNDKCGATCRRFDEWNHAIHNVNFKPADCRSRGLDYSYDAIRPEYVKWLNYLLR